MDDSIKKYQTICDTFQYSTHGALAMFSRLTNSEKNDMIRQIIFKTIHFNEEYVDFLFDNIKIKMDVK